MQVTLANLKAKTKINLEMKPIGIQEVDEFFDKASDIMIKAIQEEVKPLKDVKISLLEAAGFLDEPGASKFQRLIARDEACCSCNDDFYECNQRRRQRNQL